MFVVQKDKKIILTRGDTATILVEVYDLDGKQYEILDTDIIKMTVRKAPKSEVSFEKTADASHYFTIAPEDTSDLNSGLYVYDVQLQSGDNIYTIVPMSYFELKSEVTY